jgi:flagellar motor switch protein FliN/FliY
MSTENTSAAEQMPQKPDDDQDSEQPVDVEEAAEEAAQQAGDADGDFDDSDEAQDFTEEAEDALNDLPEWANRQLENLEGDGEDEQQQPPDQSPGQPPAQQAPQQAADESAGPDLDQYQQAAPNLDLMLDLPLDVTVELGRAELPLAKVLDLKAGSVVQLDRLPGEPLDLYVNDQLVARGEVVVLNETFAFRITDLIETGKGRS